MSNEVNDKKKISKLVDFKKKKLKVLGLPSKNGKVTRKDDVVTIDEKTAKPVANVNEVKKYIEETINSPEYKNNPEYREEVLKTVLYEYFSFEYLLDFNPMLAYRRVRDKLRIKPVIENETSLDDYDLKQGMKLLSDPRTKLLLQEILLNVSSDETHKIERLLLEYTRLAYTTPKSFFNKDKNLLHICDLPDGVAACISDFKVFQKEDGSTETYAYRMWNKTVAMEAVANYLGLFEKDRDEVEDKLRKTASTIKKSLDAMDLTTANGGVNVTEENKAG